jgi:hypothetical protein
MQAKEVMSLDDVSLIYDSKEGDVITDYIANLYNWLIISEHCKNVLADKLDKKVEFLPIRIDESWSGDSFYAYAINVLDMVDGAVDLDSSKYTILEYGDIKKICFSKYSLKESVLTSYSIFRIKEDNIPIFVNEELKNLIEKEQLSGFRFNSVQTI